VGGGHDEPREAPPGGRATLRSPTIRRALLLRFALLAGLTVAWVGAAALWKSHTAARDEAAVAGALASVRAVFDAAQDEVRREAALLARDPAVIAGALRRDWATLARGASLRMVTLTLERLVDLLVVLDAAGVPIVQVPATPRAALPVLPRPAEPVARLGLVGDSVYVLGLAPLPDGAVIVGRRFESLERALARLPSRAAVVVLAGDRALAVSRPGLPATGWAAVTHARAVSLMGETWLARPLEAAGASGVWALVPDDGRTAAERRFWHWWAVSLVAVGGGVLASALVSRPRPSGDRPARHDRRGRQLEALYRETERQAERMTALAGLGRLLSETLDFDRVAQRVADSVCALLRARSSCLYRLDPATGGLAAVTVSSGAGASFRWNEALAPGAGIAGLAVRERGAVATDDALTDSRIAFPGDMRARVAGETHRAMLAVPLLVQGRPLGALAVSDRAGRRFDASEIGLAQAFADQAALALENARLYREAREPAGRLAALEEVNRLVSSSLKMEEVLRNIAAAVGRFFDAPSVTVWVLEEASRRLTRSLVYGPPETAAQLPNELALGEGAIGWVALHREPMLWVDVETDPRIVDGPLLARQGLRFITAYPIVLGERVLGAFAVYRATPTPITPETASLLGSLAAQAAVALENARLYSATQRRLEETRALLEVVEILSSTLDSKRLLQRATMKVAQVCLVDRCSLALWEGGQVTPLMSQFADGRRVPEQWAAFRALVARPILEVPANALARETRRPVIVNDTAQDTLLPREWIETFGVKSYLVVPMLRQQQVIGVMTLDYCGRPTAFEPWQVNLAMTIGREIALSLENTRLYAESQERLRETTTLLAVGEILSRPGPAVERLREVAREIARATRADMVGAYFLDERREALGGYRVPKELLERFLTRPIVLARNAELLPAWRAGRATWSSDPQTDARFDPDWVGALPPLSVLFASATARGEPIGALFLVWWRPGRQFEPAEIRLIEGVAAQVGLAMENAELARQTEIKLRETETLLSVSHALASTVDLEALLRHFLRTVTRAVQADSAGVWLRTGDGEWLEPVAGYHVPPERLEALRAIRLSLERHAFYAEAARTKRPVASSHVAADPRAPAIMLDVMPHRSQLFVPIVVKDRVIGGFGLIWREREREFSVGEIALMEAIANQAGVAIENSRLFEENRRQVEELSVLHALSRAVTGQLDRAAVVDAIHAQVARVLDVSNMVVALHDEERREVEIALRIVNGARDTQAPLRYPATAVGLMSVVLATGRAIRTDDYDAECVRHGVAPISASAQLRRWLGVPMLAGDRPIGVLTLRGGTRAFTEADERLLTNIAHLAALALRSARLFDERARAYGDLAAAQDQLVRTEKLRALGEMASGVAHDFNNLLASILGRAQLVLQRTEAPKLRQWLQVIERSALDGAATVRRLQEFARIRRDQPFVAVDLNDVVRDALEITQSRWRQEPRSRGVTVEVRTAFGAPPRIAGDASEMREALTNLILNAVDAMPEGGVLTLTTGAEGGEGVVTVADTGVGIPDALRARIFDPFFTTKGPHGTGLGLSMTYGIVERHGGRIGVESAEGQGTTFRLTFPAGAPAEPAVAEPTPGAPADIGTSLRCLVVDDEPVVGAMLGDVLESGGHRAVVLTDGGEAIARFGAEAFDVVFTDLAMPRVSGWQVARAIKEMAPTVPVFLVTGFGVELSEEERRTHAVDLVLVKPLQIHTILDVVAQAVQRRAHPTRTEDDR
jgi:GAF domain-containing protein/CheY-like chemotaxis protein